MTTLAYTPTNHSFLHNMVKVRSYRQYLLMGMGISIVSFVLFKLLYPYPDFFSDSYSYLDAASANLDVAIWPIGYSKFLRAFHYVTHSDTALVGFQYFFLQLSVLYFFVSVVYLFQPGKVRQKILFIFLIINPLSLYLCNTINSDALFAGLSILWVTLLLWILHKPRPYQLFVHAVLLFFCFTVRSNAYYYPIVAIIAFLLTRMDLKWRLAGILLPFLFIIPFVIHTRNEAYKLTGARQFSLFTGWQLANNALYIYDQIEVDSTKLLTTQARSLNREAIKFFHRVNPAVYRNYLESYVGNFFIRQSEAPLKQYYIQHYANEPSIIVAWGKASADFEPFGEYIIMSHPFAYVRYFMIPNTWHYLMPPLSHLEKYNYGEDSIELIAKVWFHYPSQKIRVWSHGFQEFLLMYAAFFLMFNAYYVWYLIAYFRRQGLRRSSTTIQSAIVLTACFLLLNFGFSVFATLNILRYQFVPMIVLLGFSLLISDCLEKLTLIEKDQKKKYVPNMETSNLYRIHKQPIQ